MLAIVTENFRVSLWDPEMGVGVERRAGLEACQICGIQVCGWGRSSVAMLLSFLRQGRQEQVGSKQKGKG